MPAACVGAFGYDRERGRYKLFHAKAVVLATGGIGRAYKITSNSWEYTGDGHSLAYHAGATLLGMEFVQFHPTGMVWPPSVRGILVTEGVRGEGGVLLNNQGKRFMFDDIPANYRSSTADSPEEGWHYTQGDKNARRPPELLTATTWRAASCGSARRPRQPARQHVPRHRLDQGKAAQCSRAHQEEAAQHVSPIQATRRHGHHEGADGDRPHHALYDGRHAGESGHPDVGRGRLVRRRRVRRRDCMAPIAWAEIRSPICWSSASARASMRPSSPRIIRLPFRIDNAQVDEVARQSSSPSGERVRSPFQSAVRSAGFDAGSGWHRPPRR